MFRVRAGKWNPYAGRIAWRHTGTGASPAWAIWPSSRHSSSTRAPDPKKPNREDIRFDYKMRWFNDVRWRTAQTTTALSYIPYDEALEFSNIYDEQDEIDTQERQAIRDAVVAVGPLENLKPGDVNPGGEQADRIKEHFEILQGQLKHIQSLIKELDGEYKTFLAAHPE